MRKIFLKVVSLMVLMTMLSSMVIPVSAAEYPDDGYWANEAINAAIANGLLRGKEDGKIHSEDNLTRAEMAAIMVRSFGATIRADVSNFSDLDPSAWYYDEFSKAVQMRVFEGDGSGHMRPDEPITREEVFAVVARALVLKSSDHSALDKFKDAGKISGWAKDYMSILTEKSYVNGDNAGRVNPKNNITRAEFAQLMHNIFRNYYSDKGKYEDNKDSHSSMVNVGNVTFRNATINGDLVIGDGNAKGTIRLENVKINGRLLVRGANRVELVRTTVGEMVVVNNYNTTVHFDNYKTEKVFDGIIENTKATFKKRSGGGSSVAYCYITYDVDGGTPIYGDTIRKGEDLTLPGAGSTTKTGYVLNGWNVNGTIYSPGATVSGITTDTTIKAEWELATYTITYDVDGGSAISDGTLTYGDVLTLPGSDSTLKSGYKLTGWMVNGTEYAPGATVSGISADTTIKAVWTDVEFTVTFDTNGGTAIANGTAVLGEGFVLPGNNSTEKTGFYLKGWNVNGTEYVPGATVTGIDADTTVKAVWEAVTPSTKYGSYTVKFYQQNTDLTTYQHISGDDITVNNVVVGSFTYTADADKYTGFDISSGYASITKDITENGMTTFEVRYDREMYTIIYDANGGTAINNGKAYYGVDFNLPTVGTTTKTGYVLDGWMVNGTKYAPGAMVSGIAADATIKAVWTAETYTITYNTDGGSIIPPATVKYGDVLTLPAVGETTKTGYVLTGWNVNGTKYAPGATVSGISADTTIKAVWELEKYTITYDVDGGSAIPNGTAKYGEGFVLPGNNSTTKTGFYLKGWNVNGTEYVPGATVTGIDADTTVKAVWEAVTPSTKYGSYTVKFYQQNTDLTTYQHISGDDITVNNVVVGSFTYTADADKYTGFDISSGYASITKDITENGMTTFEVRYDREKYEVAYNVDGGTAMSDGTAYYGIDFTLPALGSTTKTGWVLTGWEVNGTQYGLGVAVSGITADITAKAIWTRETYTVTYDVDGGTPIDDDTATFGYGFTLPGVGSTTKAGHVLKGWIVNGTTHNPGTAVAGIVADTIIKAVWETETYDVTFNTDGGSAIAPTTVKYGDDLTLPALGSTTKTGYTLVGWLVKGTQYNPGAKVSDITADTEVLAVWKLDEYTITYDVDGGSDIADGKAYYGIDFTLPGIGSTTKTGHILKGWTINGTSYDLGAKVSGITADTTVKAVWEAETYTVTYDVDGGSAIAPETIKYGDDLTLPALGSTTKTDYVLKGWNVNGTKYAPGAIISGITANVIAKAIWEAETPSVKYGSYVVKFYKQNAEGQYEYVTGDDESGTAEVGSYTVSVNSNKYDGYVLSATNVYTMDIVEGQTTEFKVYYDIKPAGVEYNTVTFYYRTNVVGTTDVEKGTTVPEAQFPDYMKTYNDGHVKNVTISPVYTTPYQHTVNYGWWYNPEAEKWQEFTPETVVNSDMDVYLKISKFNAIVTLGTGEQFNFFAFYESDTRFTDTIKDVIYSRGPLEALKVSGYMDKVRENGKVQKILDEDDNIMMLSYMVRFSQILGEENVEKFIVDNAKEMFASGNNKLLHDAFVEYIIAVANSTNPDEKKKVHDLMESTINHIFEEDVISTETLDLIRDLCDKVLNDPDIFKEVTGYEIASLPSDTKTFVIDYIIQQLSGNDELFKEIVKEVTGVDYTDTTTTKDIIIAMAEKQLTDNFASTIDEIKYSHKNLIINTVKSMLGNSSNGLYDEVLTYAVTNEKATIISTIKTLLTTEDSLYDEVIGIIADDTGYRAMVAEAVGTELAANDALFEVLTGYDPATVPDRAAAINTLKDEITNNKSSFEDAIADAENAGYKSFIIDSIVSKLETNDTFFNVVLEKAKVNYRATMVNTIVSKLEEPASAIYEKVIELAKTNAYKQTIKNAIIDEMNGTNGDSLIAAIADCTVADLSKDPQDKDGLIMKKAKQKLNDDDYLSGLIEDVTGYENYTLPATPKDFITDMVIVELSNTGSTSATRDMIIEEAIAYLLEVQDVDEIEHLADYAIDYLANHPDERDALVDEIINDVYKDELDKLVDQLIKDEKFEVHADTVFVAEGLKAVLLRDYNYETIFGSKVPVKLEKLFEIYPEEKLIELYDYAMNNLIAQIDTAIADAIAGGTGYIDCGITPVVNIIADVYVPLYESFKKILEGPVDDKVGDNFYYKENIYLQELIKLLDPEVWVQGSANAKPSDTTGYKIYDIDYYYDLFYKIYVLSDDAIMWYYNNISEEKYIEVTENYEELILKYVNILADKIDLYVMEGEIPKINEKVDDKISAAEKAIVEKYPELVKGLIEKYKDSEFFNKDYTGVDYDKVRDKVYDAFNRTLHLKTEEYFDIVLNQEAYEDLENKYEDKIEDKLDGKLDGEYYTKIDDDSYEFEVNDYKIRFIRERKNTLY